MKWINKISRLKPRMPQSSHTWTVLAMLTGLALLVLCANFPAFGGFLAAAAVIAFIYWVVLTIIKLLRDEI